MVAVASAGKPPSWKWKGPEEKAGLVLEEEVEVVLVAAVLCSGPALVAVLLVVVVDEVDDEVDDVFVVVSGPGLASWSGELSAVAPPSILSITPLAFLIMSFARLSLTRGLDCPMAPTDV